MSKKWRVIITMVLVLMMGIAIVSSAGNGSTIGDMLQESQTIQKIQKKYKNIIGEAIQKENNDLPKLYK